MWRAQVNSPPAASSGFPPCASMGAGPAPSVAACWAVWALVASTDDGTGSAGAQAPLLLRGVSPGTACSSLYQLLLAEQRAPQAAASAWCLQGPAVWMKRAVHLAAILGMLLPLPLETSGLWAHNTEQSTHQGALPTGLARLGDGTVGGPSAPCSPPPASEPPQGYLQAATSLPPASRQCSPRLWAALAGSPAGRQAPSSLWAMAAPPRPQPAPPSSGCTGAARDGLDQRACIPTSPTCTNARTHKHHLHAHVYAHPHHLQVHTHRLHTHIT